MSGQKEFEEILLGNKSLFVSSLGTMKEEKEEFKKFKNLDEAVLPSGWMENIV